MATSFGIMPAGRPIRQVGYVESRKLGAAFGPEGRVEAMGYPGQALELFWPLFQLLRHHLPGRTLCLQSYNDLQGAGRSAQAEPYGS